MTAAAPETPATPGQAALPPLPEKWAPWDAQAKQDYAEFSAWWQAKGYRDGESLDFSDARDAFASGMRAARQPQPAPGRPEVAYLYHRRFDRGEEFGLYRHAADADAKAAEHAGDGLSEVLGMAILGDTALGTTPQPAPSELAERVGQVENELAEAEETIGTYRAENIQLTRERDGAYRERARLVAFLAACYESEMTQQSDDDPWPVIYVLGPTGQMSWHIARADLRLFDHVGWYGAEPAWDGHSTEEKYERLATLIPHALDMRHEQPAPELAGSVVRVISTVPKLREAVAESRRYREALERIFRQGSLDACTCSVVAGIARRALEGK